MKYETKDWYPSAKKKRETCLVGNCADLLMLVYLMAHNILILTVSASNESLFSATTGKRLAVQSYEKLFSQNSEAKI